MERQGYLHVFSIFVETHFAMLTIVAAFDSFKGCMTAQEACHAVAEALPDHKVIELPLSDGGEGLLDVFVNVIGGSLIKVSAHDALMRPCEAEYFLSSDGKVAFVEMARVCGLEIVPLKYRNPELTTTFGLGEIIADALSRGCREFVIGVGGSATNDAGTGMMQALGYFFMGKGDKDIFETMCGKLLPEVESIDETNVAPQLGDSKFTIVCDVENPLYGSNGAAFVFAPQKGADMKMVERLDKALRCFSHGAIEANEKGAGAAGGVGFAFRRFFNADLKRGIDVVLDLLQFDEVIKGASIILTGEGKSDRQTLMGKVASGVLNRAKVLNVDVALLSGSIAEPSLFSDCGFSFVRSINEGCDLPLEKQMETNVAMRNLSVAARKLISDIKQNQPNT